MYVTETWRGEKRSKPITSEGTTTSEPVTMTTVNKEEMRDNIKANHLLYIAQI